MIKSRMIRKSGFDQTHPSRFTGMWSGAAPSQCIPLIGIKRLVKMTADSCGNLLTNFKRSIIFDGTGSKFATAASELLQVWCEQLLT